MGNPDLISGDYHDYFIKDGRHLGLYEQMYRYCPDPWRIEETGLRLDMKAALMLLEHTPGRVRLFLDVGAGLGFFSRLAAEAVWKRDPGARGIVTDISPTAVDRAAARLADPRLEFRVLDLRLLADDGHYKPAGFDLVIMAQVLWGLLENLDGALAAVERILAPEGRLLVSQHFPPPGRQSYGADLVAGPEDLAARLEALDLTLVHTLETDRRSNHHWAALARKSGGSVK